MHDHMALSDGSCTEGITRKISVDLTKTPSRAKEANNDVTQQKVWYMLYANNKHLSF